MQSYNINFVYLFKILLLDFKRANMKNLDVLLLLICLFFPHVKWRKAIQRPALGVSVCVSDLNESLCPCRLLSCV